MFGGSDFSAPAIASKLTDRLAALQKYNGLTAHLEYFDAAMDFLSVSVDGVTHPLTPAAAAAAAEQKAIARTLPAITKEQLVAGIWFYRAYLAPAPENKDYSEAIGANPEEPAAYNNRGYVRLECGNGKGALGDFGGAIRLKPDYAGAYLNRGVVYGRLGEFAKAHQDLNQAIRLDPGYAEAYSNRALLHEYQQNWELAKKDFDEAIRLNPHFANARYERARLLERLQDSRGAIVDYQWYLAGAGTERRHDHDEVATRIRHLQEHIRR